MSKREHRGRAVRKEIRIHAPADAIYAAWADPERIARWFVDRAERTMRAGETVTWHFDAFGMKLPIEVYEAEPGRTLAFGGERPGRPPALQEVLLEREGEVTILRLVNSGFLEGDEWDEEFEGVDSGWTLALAQLRHWLEQHADAPRVHHRMVMRPAPFEYADLQRWFRTAACLAEWLGDDVSCDPEPLEAGARVRLTVDGALPLDGAVLAASDRELLLGWPEEDAVLALKAFAAGPDQRMIALDYRAWGRGDADADRVQPHLDAAVARLAARLADG